MLHEGHRQSRAKLEPTLHQVRVSNSIQHGYERKLSINHGQTFLLKGNFICKQCFNFLYGSRPITEE